MNIQEFKTEYTDYKLYPYKKENVFYLETGYVYFLCDDSYEINYIGSTENLYKRISAHALRRMYKLENIYYIIVADEDRIATEKLFISLLNPIRNCHYNVDNYPIYKPCNPITSYLKAQLGRMQYQAYRKEKKLAQQATQRG
jgi:hypothetical protein